MALANYYYSHYSTDYNNKINKFSYNEYNGSEEIANKVSNVLVNIYQNPKNMRKETYLFSNEYKIINYISDDDFVYSIRNRYARPYQKNWTIGINGREFIKQQKQMPAYFMNIIAGAMHTYNNTGITITPFTSLINQVSLLTTPLIKTYVVAANIIAENSKKITTPHYLETYYILTKNISVTDFK